MRPTPAITRARTRSRVSPRLLWTIAIALLIIILGSVFLSTYVGWQLTHPVRKPLTESPDKYGLRFDDIQFPSRGGDVRLNGWFMPADEPQAGMTVIVAHGYAENREQKEAGTLALARTLVKSGYNVVMFDFRNSGLSEGKLTSVGYFERHDLLGAVDWVKANRPGKIALIGFSMGASTSLLAAAEEPAVSGVVADSPFNHLTRYLQQNLPVWSHLPNYPFTPLILGILPPLTGIDPDAVDALSAVDRVYPRPVLFIHSVNDRSIPALNSETMAAKHPDRFELWEPYNEGHARSHASLPEPYEAKVLAFLDRLR